MNEKHKCAWGSDIPEIKTTLKILVKKIDEDTKHRSEVDKQQFDILRNHGERISAAETGITNLGKRYNNLKGNPQSNPGPSRPDDFWQYASKVKKAWLLFLFIGGAAAIKLVGVLLEQIGAWLQNFSSTL